MHAGMLAPDSRHARWRRLLILDIVIRSESIHRSCTRISTLPARDRRFPSTPAFLRMSSFTSSSDALLRTTSFMVTHNEEAEMREESYMSNLDMESMNSGGQRGVRI